MRTIKYLLLMIFVLAWGTAVAHSQPILGDYDCTAVAEIPQTECSALLALYNSTDGANWAVSNNWLANNTPCAWFGVDCSAGHVSGLDLDNNNLSGPLPSELGNLASLTILDMDGNQLSGPVPPALGNLGSLVILDVSDNQLDGPIPQSFTNLTLTVFAFGATTLCEPDNMAFQDWLATITNLDSTHVLCTDPFVGLNFRTGASGSFLTLTAAIFPANTNANIYVNNQLLGAVPTGADGNFTFLLSTTMAAEGFYGVRIETTDAVATTSFTLTADAPLRLQDGTGFTFNVPAGLAFSHFAYLPFIPQE